MQATRFRLRFVTGVTLSARTYGAGTYGDGTYGEQASDPLASIRYTLIPLPAGYPTVPSWLYRSGDSGGTFQALVMSDSGPLDLSAIDNAQLVLTPIDGQTGNLTFLLGLPDVGTVERTWLPGDLSDAGTYRAVVVFTFTSGRRLTVPGDDNLRFVVTP
jgi:hypothetical protein